MSKEQAKSSTSSTASPAAAKPDRSVSKTNSPATKPERLMSLDAYRGFIMLAMASAALGFKPVFERFKQEAEKSGTEWTGIGRWCWEALAYQFEHVPWAGCGFWDLIQPSFMFMVGVALPFSIARRKQEGQSEGRRFLHVLWRSFLLIALGVFLSSNGSPLTNFTFVNVLTQIGLGYPFLYLLCRKSLRVQLGVAIVILLGYWSWFATYTTPAAEFEQVTQAIRELKKKDETEWTQFTGFASHWNKHTNAAAAVDHTLLNMFPRKEDKWYDRKFWVNDGGYQTLNFIPSLATMILGLMAGTILRSSRSDREKLLWLLKASGICFLVVLPIDTTIWPFSIPGCTWSLCPSVKRIWTPTWAVFSSGWTYLMLAGFYWTIDIRKWRWWAFPCVVVGMNSIAMYCMSQTLKPWVRDTLKTHLATLDAGCGCEKGIVYHVFDMKNYAYAAIWEKVAVLFVFWLVCFWMYRRKIFLKI